MSWGVHTHTHAHTHTHTHTQDTSHSQHPLNADRVPALQGSRVLSWPLVLERVRCVCVCVCVFSYTYEILTRTADGDEGGKHQLIKATVSNGKLWILKVRGMSLCMRCVCVCVCVRVCVSHPSACVCAGSS